MASEALQIERTDGGDRLALSGEATLADAGRLRSELLRAFDEAPVRTLDLSSVARLDGAAAAVLADAVARPEQRPEVTGATRDVRAVLDLYLGDDEGPRVVRGASARVGLLEQVGDATVELVRDVRGMLEFLGEATAAAGRAVARPATVAWGQIVRQLERHGADGLPIVCAIGFLIGLITAFQAALQLAKFGADTLVADLVGLSLTRELAPLMTAIVVAGRSGAAMAAELGTMRVSEEIDALETLGICPYRWLVFPRVVAAVVALPLLTLVADVVGVVGGAIVAVSTLEVSLVGFAGSLRDALDAADVLAGLFKAAVFGAIIALVACERGLATRGGAEGVGRSTTRAVVSTLFCLVVTDALFAVLFNLWGVF